MLPKRVLITLVLLAIPVGGIGLVVGKNLAVELKVTNLERVNTPADEDDPAAAPDGLGLYFASNAGGHFDLMCAVRKVRTQPFANAKPIEELVGKTDDRSPCPLPRGREGDEYFYYASQRDAKNFDLFFVRRLKPSEPFLRAIGAVHNVCTDADELHPCVMADEMSMFFSRKTADGWRVGFARGTERRAFDKVELLDFPAGLHHPSVSKDGLTMYLHGPVENGGEKLGIFVSTRANKNAKWSKPAPVAVLNHQESVKGDCSPWIAADGAALYFASDRPGGKGGLDLYVVLTTELKRAMDEAK